VKRGIEGFGLAIEADIDSGIRVDLCGDILGSIS